MDMEKLEKEAPGFMRVYESVKRLALFHKIDLGDCQEMALVAIIEHPGCISAAIRVARRELNAERRQRRGGRPVDDRVDGGEAVEVEIEADLRTLPEGIKPSALNDDGEWDEIAGGDQEQAADLDDHDDRDLPMIVPHDLVGEIIFWARCGADVAQIAELTGRTPERIRQILRDPEKIRQAIAYVEANPTLPGLGLENYLPAPRKPIKHKPRQADEDQDHKQTLSFFEMEEEELV
jgi:hypothetical protein